MRTRVNICMFHEKLDQGQKPVCTGNAESKVVAFMYIRGGIGLNVMAHSYEVALNTCKDKGGVLGPWRREQFIKSAKRAFGHTPITPLAKTVGR